MCLVDMVFRTVAHTLCVVCLQIHLAWSTFECALIPWQRITLPPQNRLLFSILLQAHVQVHKLTLSLSHTPPPPLPKARVERRTYIACL